MLLFTLLLTYFSTLHAEELQPGLIYTKHSTPDSHDSQIVHVLTINPKLFTLKSVHAKECARGVETVESLARRFNATAAINGGFFRMGEKMDGLPAGVLKIDGCWYGLAYKNRGALGWSNPKSEIAAIRSELATGISGSAVEVSKKTNSSKKIKELNPSLPIILLDRIQTKTNLIIANKKFKVYGINQPGVASRAILYTPGYGPTTDSSLGGMDIIIQNDKVVEVVASGQTPIPRDGYVYSIGPKVPRLEFKLEKGDPVKFDIMVQPSFNKRAQKTWQTLDNIVGGIPLLLENNRILKDYGTEKISSVFIDRRHARTAFGILKNGHWVFAVAEKSQNSGSLGMTLPEFASFLQALGCRTAVNLDGGTSSTLYANHTVLNVPQGEVDENLTFPVTREIADALLILPKS